jgi:hypothetical protein
MRKYHAAAGKAAFECATELVVSYDRAVRGLRVYIDKISKESAGTDRDTNFLVVGDYSCRRFCYSIDVD